MRRGKRAGVGPVLRTTMTRRSPSSSVSLSTRPPSITAASLERVAFALVDRAALQQRLASDGDEGQQQFDDRRRAGHRARRPGYEALAQARIVSGDLGALGHHRHRSSPSSSSIRSRKRAFFNVVSIIVTGTPVTIASGIAGNPPPEPMSTSDSRTCRRDGEAVENLRRKVGRRLGAGQIELAIRLEHGVTVGSRNDRGASDGAPPASRSARSSLALNEEPYDRDIGRRHARNAARRTKRARALRAQFLPCLARECRNIGIVEVDRDDRPLGLRPHARSRSPGGARSRRL